LPPCRTPLRHGLHSGGGCHLARSGGQTGGSQGNSHHPSRRCASNAGEGSKPQSPEPPTPLGFSSPFFPCARRERRRREGKRGGEGIVVGACFAYAGAPRSRTPEPEQGPLRQAAPPSPSGLLRLHRRPKVRKLPPFTTFPHLGLFPVMHLWCRGTPP
jgi:hypothetical protein